jgi:hypothetical protein
VVVIEGFKASVNEILGTGLVPGCENMGKLVVPVAGFDVPTIGGGLTPNPLDGSKPVVGLEAPNIDVVLPKPLDVSNGAAGLVDNGGVLPKPFEVSKAVVGLAGIADD